MRYLITGGSGFIGSHLVEHIMNDGNNDDIIVIDNLSTGRKSNIQKMIDQAESSYSSFDFYCDSILNEDLMDQLVKQCDYIFHLAANVGVDRVEKTPFLTLQDDIKGTEIVLAKAKKYWKPTLIMSSSEVYGFAPSPLYEEDFRSMPGGLRSAYAEVKVMAELLAMAYYKEYGLPVTLVRLFNTTGERQLSDYGMVIPSFIKAKLFNMPVVIYGNGTQSRCFSYVKDIAEALYDLIHIPEAYGEVFNLGSDVSITISDLAKKIFGVNKLEDITKFSFAPAREFDTLTRVPITTKIKQVLSYEPISTSLSEIIKKITDYELAKKQVEDHFHATRKRF